MRVNSGLREVSNGYDIYIYIYMVSVPTKTHQSYCSMVFRYFTKYIHIHIHIYIHIYYHIP